MSTPPQLSFASSAPNIVAFDDDFGREPSAVYHDNDHYFPPTLIAQNHQPCHLWQRSIPEDTPSFSDVQYFWHTHQVYDNLDPSMLATAHVAHTQIPTTIGLWDLFDVQLAAEVLSTSCSSTAVNEGHGSDMMSICYPAHDPGQNVTQWDGYTAFDPPGTSSSTSADRQPVFPLVDPANYIIWHHSLDQSYADPSHTCSSHATYPHYASLSIEKNVTEPSFPCRPPQSFSPTSPYFSPHPTSTGFPETVSRPHPAFYGVPHWISGPPRHRCEVRAIEYNGLLILIDDDALRKGLTEPDEKFTVHPCRWDEDHSPCGLWIRGDKSYISAHIQKWHGGKPGGDKFRVHCCWSACGKAMAKESITRHIVSIHLGEVWRCQGCRKAIVRGDAYRQHALRSKSAACRTSGALVTYSADTLEIDARAALERGRRLPYTDA